MKKLERKIYYLMAGLGSVSLGIIIFAIAYQIVLRLGRNATPWSEELAQLGLIGMVMFGLYVVERDNEQLRMELIFSIFPKTKLPLEILGNFLNITLAAFLIYSETLFIPSVMKRATQALKIPLRYVHYLMLACAVIWILAAIAQTVYEIYLLMSGKKGENK